MKRFPLILVVAITMVPSLAFAMGKIRDRADKDPVAPVVQKAPPTPRIDTPEERQSQEYAATICSKASFGGDVARCLGEVRKGRFYDHGAVDVCKQLDFGSYFASCLSVIADKTFFEAELTACRGVSFDNDRIVCLRSCGAAYVPVIPPEVPPSGLTLKDVLVAVKRIQDSLVTGAIPKALEDLAALVRDVEKATANEESRAG